MSKKPFGLTKQTKNSFETKVMRPLLFLILTLGFEAEFDLFCSQFEKSGLYAKGTFLFNYSGNPRS